MLKRLVFAAAVAAAPLTAWAEIPIGVTAHPGLNQRLAPAPGPPTGGFTYSFNLVSFKITETRALHKDTDFVGIAVANGHDAPIVLPAILMGDVNNGTFAVNQAIPNITVKPGDNLTVSYIIVNTAADPADVQKELDQFLATTAAAEERAPPETVIGRHASEWQIKSIYFTGCDGTVAAAHHGFTADQLAAGATGGRFIGGTDDNPGNDSQTGCGSNSQYYVTWSIQQSPSP